MLPNKLPFTDSLLGRTCISGLVRSCSRRTAHYVLFCECGIYRSRTPVKQTLNNRQIAARAGMRFRSIPYVGMPGGHSNPTPAPERARCRSANPRRQQRARAQSKSKHSARGPGGHAVPIDSARAGSHLMWLPCEPGLDRSGTACPPGPLRQFLTYPIPREERE